MTAAGLLPKDNCDWDRFGGKFWTRRSGPGTKSERVLHTCRLVVVFEPTALGTKREQRRGKFGTGLQNPRIHHTSQPLRCRHFCCGIGNRVAQLVRKVNVKAVGLGFARRSVTQRPTSRP